MDDVCIVQERGVTVVMGDPKRDEWIRTEDMGPISVERFR